MSLVPTMSLRQYRDADGTTRLQQMFLKNAVVAIWSDVPIVSHNDPDEVRRQNINRSTKVPTNGI